MFRLRMLWVTNTLKLNARLYSLLFSLQLVLVGVIWGLFYFVTPNLPLGEDFWFIASLLASVLVQVPVIFMAWNGIGAKLNKLYELTFPNCYAFVFKKLNKRDVPHVEILKKMNKYLKGKTFAALVKAETQDQGNLEALTFMVAPSAPHAPVVAAVSKVDPREILSSKGGAWLILITLAASFLLLVGVVVAFVIKSTFFMLALGIAFACVVLFGVYNASKRLKSRFFYPAAGVLAVVFALGLFFFLRSGDSNVSAVRTPPVAEIPVASAQSEVSVPKYDETLLVSIGTGQVTQNLSQMATKIAKTTLDLFRTPVDDLERKGDTRVPWDILLNAKDSAGVGMLARDTIVQDWYNRGYDGIDENGQEVYFSGTFSQQVMYAVSNKALDITTATAYIDTAKLLADYSATQLKLMSELAKEHPDFVFAGSVQESLNQQAMLFNRFSDALGLVVQLPQLDIVTTVQQKWDPGTNRIYMTATPLPQVVYPDSLKNLLNAQTATAAPTTTPVPPTETHVPQPTETVDYSQIPGSITHGMSSGANPTQGAFEANAALAQASAGVADPAKVCELSGMDRTFFLPSTFVPNRWASWSALANDTSSDLVSGVPEDYQFQWITCLNGGYAVNYVTNNVGTPWTFIQAAPPQGLPKFFGRPKLKSLLP